MRLLKRRATEPSLEAAARALREAWQAPRADGAGFLLRRGREELRLDLAERKDRFALLLLAILAGAKVQEATAVATLKALREQGLTDPDRLAERRGEDGPAVLAVLQEHYRALASKAQKVEALFAAAERVARLYGGDLRHVHQPGRAWTETLQALREFPHLKSRAYWLCREMRRHGSWPDLEPQACAAVDVPVKLALWRLGFVGPQAAFLRDIPTADCLAAISRYFGGDALPLFYQGERLCRPGQTTLCAGECRVAAYCRWSPRLDDAPNTEQPFGLSTGTCG
jgi:DNA-binding transcriptional ArsR family regulator